MLDFIINELLPSNILLFCKLAKFLKLKISNIGKESMKLLLHPADENIFRSNANQSSETLIRSHSPGQARLSAENCFSLSTHGHSAPKQRHDWTLVIAILPWPGSRNTALPLPSSWSLWPPPPRLMPWLARWLWALGTYTWAHRPPRERAWRPGKSTRLDVQAVWS